MKATINSSLLKGLKPNNKPYDVRDDKLTGFLIRVNISGKLLFMCEYARGKRVTIGKVGVLSVAQARDRALAILSDTAKGIDPKINRTKKSNITLEEFIREYYAPWVKEHRKCGERTLAHINRCFINGFGKKALTDITPALLDQWRTKRLKNGLTTETVNRDIATFKAALSKAVLWGLIEKHPLEKFKLLKVDRNSKVRFLTKKEEQSLRLAITAREAKAKSNRENANKWRMVRGYELLPNLNDVIYIDHLGPMILLAINTGLRRGELFNLRWENVDLDKALCTIEGSYAKSGKTRHIPLNSEALRVLQLWRKQTGSVDLVFPGKDGYPFNNVKKAWTGILKLAKINNFRWHDMRHHFASKLVMSDVDLNTVRELLGHSDMAMTLRYAHLAPEHKANAVERLVSKID